MLNGRKCFTVKLLATINSKSVVNKSSVIIKETSATFIRVACPTLTRRQLQNTPPFSYNAYIIGNIENIYK